MNQAESLPQRIDLWPEMDSFPTLDIYLPEENPTGTGVVVCPGGGYGTLCEQGEGADVARWFNARSVAAFVLRYRHGEKHRYPEPIDDGRRAIRYARYHAEKFSLAADRIGVMGFSAGGHLASVVSTHLQAGQADAADPVQRCSAIPSFTILAYPLITLVGEAAHVGSRDNLFGPGADAAMWEKLSSDRHVNAQTPPAFIYHTDQDKTVPAENPVNYYLALRRHGVPAELHVFRAGAHGTWLGCGDKWLSVWPTLLARWMAGLGLMAENQI